MHKGQPNSNRIDLSQERPFMQLITKMKIFYIGTITLQHRISPRLVEHRPLHTAELSH